MNLLDLLKTWHGVVEVDGAVLDDSSDLLTGSQSVRCINLRREFGNSSERKTERVDDDLNTVYQVTVKSYMTKKATPSFDFMAKWNNNIPMPLMTMVGTIEKETPGMVYMKLHGDIVSEVTPVCMCCGREITNPVSQYFGLGPICGHHNYVNPFNSKKELQDAINKYRTEYLNKITWEGWIIKSAITAKKQIKEEN